MDTAPTELVPQPKPEEQTTKRKKSKKKKKKVSRVKQLLKEFNKDKESWDLWETFCRGAEESVKPALTVLLKHVNELTETQKNKELNIAQAAEVQRLDKAYSDAVDKLLDEFQRRFDGLLQSKKEQLQNNENEKDLQKFEKRARKAMQSEMQKLVFRTEEEKTLFADYRQEILIQQHNQSETYKKLKQLVDKNNKASLVLAYYYVTPRTQHIVRCLEKALKIAREKKASTIVQKYKEDRKLVQKLEENIERESTLNDLNTVQQAQNFYNLFCKYEEKLEDMKKKWRHIC